MNYAYWLSNIPGVGNRTRKLLQEWAGTAKAVYGLTERELQEIPGLGEQEIAEIRKSRERDWQKLYEGLKDRNICFMSTEDAEFPEKLKEIPDAPYSIYVRGKLPDPAKKSIAIVGARMCSPYGQAAARKLGEVLAGYGAQIISGMAKGIDSAGHTGAIAGGGNTFAVLGNGVDICYPASNRNLYAQIGATGGLISEYPPGTQPRAGLFPMRNRIISALSDVVVVVEAKVRSGSLITADYALEQGRDVYAVPGRLFDPLSGGTNALIGQGAGIIFDPENFAIELGLQKEKPDCSEKNNQLLLEKDEALVYSCVDLRPKSLSQLLEETGMQPAVLADVLMGLSGRGLVKEYFKNCYIRNV